MLDRTSSIPLYQQLKQWMLEQIESGRWKEGDLVKTERDLAEEFGVHRLTVRQAITELATEGRVVRIRGRGTFVSSPKIQQTLGRLTSFSEDMRRLGMEPSSRVLKMEIRDATAAELGTLSMKQGEAVIELNRLRLADGIPMGLECAVLPHALCRNLIQVPFIELQSLYVTLQTKCGIELRRAEQTIEAQIPSQQLARLLKLTEGIPVLKMTRRTLASNGTPVEWVTSFYRGDRYKFRSDLLL